MKQFAQRIFVAVIVIGAILLIAYVMQGLLLVLAGVLLAILFRTAAAWLSDHARLPFRWAIALVLITTGLLLAGIVWEFGTKITAEADQLLAKLSQALASLEQRSQGYASLHQFWSRANLNLEKPAESFVSATISTTAAVILVLFVGAYTAVDADTYVDGFLKFFPPKRKTRVRNILKDAGFALKWWLFGQLIAMSVVGVITTIGLTIVSVPMALPLAFLAALFTFVPYVGAIVSSIPALMIALTVSTHTALSVALVFVIAHAAEGYVVGPIVQHRFVYLPPALILANQFLMKLVLGVVGLALATPLLVVVMVLIDQLYFREEWADTQEAA